MPSGSCSPISTAPPLCPVTRPPWAWPSSSSRRRQSWTPSLVGTAMATDAIAAGGATVEATAAGGGAGSFGGPLGTIIGIGVGLIVGVIIDWRLSKMFEAKIAQQCNRFFDTLEYHLRDGATAGGGLRAALLESTRLTNEAQAEAVRGALRQS